MTDPMIPAASFDTLDAIPNPADGEIIERDGLLYIQTGGRKYVSRNMGQIYSEVYPGGDCDGLTDDLVSPEDVTISWDGVSFVGEPITFNDGAPHATETTIPLGINGYHRVVNGVEHYHSSDGVKWVKTVDYTDTPPVMRPLPPEKVEAARKAIEVIMARQKGLAGVGWPPGWRAGHDDNSDTMYGPNLHNYQLLLPNTERGRRAAWELEGA